MPNAAGAAARDALSKSQTVEQRKRIIAEAAEQCYDRATPIRFDRFTDFFRKNLA